MASGNYHDRVFPGMLPNAKRMAVLRSYMRGEVTPEEVIECARHALEAAAGRPWWEAERLIASSLSPAAWPIVHGKLIRYGIDLDSIAIGGFCNFAYTLMIEGMVKDGERDKFDFELTRPPAGVSVDEVYDAEDAEAAFMASLAHHQTLTPSTPDA